MAETLQQTQTLSLRMSEALRKRLEDIRKLTAVKRGESVSTSEIAKQLLESAREERFEVVELLAKPTESLIEIRRKGEAGQMLTRAQWTALAYFVQQGCESFSKNALARETWVGILKAFDAAHQLRTKPSAQDEYYLGNLPGDCRPERSKPSDPATAELVRKTVGETVRRMSSPATKWTPMLAARNLYVLLDGEKLAGAAALNEALAPYWPVLWRVAARGHYFERREPVRESGRREEVYQRHHRGRNVRGLRLRRAEPAHLELAGRRGWRWQHHQLHRERVLAEWPKIGRISIHPIGHGLRRADHPHHGGDAFLQRSVFRKPPLGADGSIGFGGQLFAVLLPLGRNQRHIQSAGHLEFRDLLAGFLDRAGLREQSLLLQRLWTVYDPGPVSSDSDFTERPQNSAKLEPLCLRSR
jgi:hypothetical protein